MTAYHYLVVVQADDPADVDVTGPHGLTAEAYDRLYAAIFAAKFDVVTGPDPVT